MYTKDQLAELFSYHPPTTEERKDLHDRCNKKSLEIALLFLDWSGADQIESLRITIVSESAKLLELTQNMTCRRWVEKALEDAFVAARAGRAFDVLMHCQQARMFTNQGITIDAVEALSVFRDS